MIFNYKWSLVCVTLSEFFSSSKCLRTVTEIRMLSLTEEHVVTVEVFLVSGQLVICPNIKTHVVSMTNLLAKFNS